MFRSVVSASLGLLVCYTLVAGQPQVEQVTPRYFDRADFQYLSEYFTGREVQGDNLVIRTDPEDRSGLYFIVELSGALQALPRGAAVVVDYVDAETGEPYSRKFKIPAESRPDSRRVLIGLTGDDWPEATRSLLAWRVALVDSQESLLSEKVSFLWEMPAGQ